MLILSYVESIIRFIILDDFLVFEYNISYLSVFCGNSCRGDKFSFILLGDLK